LRELCTTDASAADADPQPVRGVEPSHASSETHPSEPVMFQRAPAPPPALAAEPARRTPSAIARDGLTFTVFIQGRGAYGAGILLDSRGHVLTCHHVIEDLASISVAFADGTSYPAKVLEVDTELDAALLQIEGGRSAALRTASIADVELGDELYALGAPRKMKFSLSRGMASFVGRAFDGVYFLQSDFALNGGSSGGPVMNARGEVVAMSSFVLRDSQGLAFALPIDYALRRFSSRLADEPALERADVDAFEGWLRELAKGAVKG
jgi:S1-C subfamily serine protease